MKKAPIPKNEFKRIESVYALDLLDTPPEERFDQLTRCATLIFHVPMSTLTIIDATREWFKSCQGTEKREGDRSTSFCGHALVENEILLIKDTAKDQRFADNPMVVGPPYIRFYAGVPILSTDGNPIGVFCIKDTKPREFSKDDQEILKGLAKWAELEINSRNVNLSAEDEFIEKYKNIKKTKK